MKSNMELINEAAEAINRMDYLIRLAQTDILTELYKRYRDEQVKDLQDKTTKPLIQIINELKEELGI